MTELGRFSSRGPRANLGAPFFSFAPLRLSPRFSSPSHSRSLVPTPSSSHNFTRRCCAPPREDMNKRFSYITRAERVSLAVVLLLPVAFLERAKVEEEDEEEEVSRQMARLKKKKEKRGWPTGRASRPNSHCIPETAGYYEHTRCFSVRLSPPSPIFPPFSAHPRAFPHILVLFPAFLLVSLYVS